MINRGANPHVKYHNGISEYERWSLDSLSNLPTIESIFYPIKSFSSGNLPKPFNYETGVYPGKYGRIIGRGGEGTVIQGEWGNEPCAFKFVEIKNQQLHGSVSEALADMNTRLREMIEMETISGSSILKLESHYR